MAGAEARAKLAEEDDINHHKLGDGMCPARPSPRRLRAVTVRQGHNAVRRHPPVLPRRADFQGAIAFSVSEVAVLLQMKVREEREKGEEYTTTKTRCAVTATAPAATARARAVAPTPSAPPNRAALERAHRARTAQRLREDVGVLQHVPGARRHGGEDCAGH